MKGTKAGILAELETELKRYAWAADPQKLANALEVARVTLNGGNAYDRSGHAWLCALERNGFFAKKTQTLKALHALPD